MARHDSRILTILHIEDDENDSVLLSKACERAKLPVLLHHVANAEQAIKYLHGEQSFADRLQFPVPQVVVLDLKLPTMTGFEFLQWLRQSNDYRQIPVLVFTSSLSRDDKSRALAAGANSYFVKPASFEALVQLVDGFGLPQISRAN